MWVVEVLIEHANYQLDQTFTYYTKDETIMEGKRVKVNFNHQELVGIVYQVFSLDVPLKTYEKKKGYQISPIIEVVDKKPLLNQELISLSKKIAYETVSPLIAVIQAMLPTKLKPKSSFTAAKKIAYIKTKPLGKELTKKQKVVYDYVKVNEPVEQSLLNKKYPGFTLRMLKNGSLERFYQKSKYQKQEIKTKDFLELTVDQQKVYDEIIDSHKKVYLLHGVTGSGKTEVYLHLAHHYIQKDQAVLFLVPEIALTPQMIRHVQSRFGDEVAIYHSYLSEQEKLEQYNRVLNKEVKLVVGTRSAIFMPFENIGLIIIDEEHDRSYKQDSLPRYHARDVAIMRAEYHQAKVLLGSATPSLESYARTLKDVYHLVELPKRISQHQTIDYQIVDMEKNLKTHSQSSIFAESTLAAIYERLQKQEQIVILLNRRGYTPVFRCNNCYEVKMCSDCEIAMSFHRDDVSLVCHVCGKREYLPVTCDHCQHQRFNWSGYGTQRVEEELQRLFKKANIVRMDADAVSKKGSHQQILDEFEHQGDILLGTQMIAKGLDFHRVTLVVVLNADAMLGRNSYRSVEDTFNLISQVSGRGGRGDLAGQLYVQSYDARHYAIVLACRNDYKNFFKMEMQYRHLANYPPFTYLIRIVLSNANEQILNETTGILEDILRTEKVWQVLGPSDLLKIKKMYRKQFILKGKDLKTMIYKMQKVNKAIQKDLKSSRIMIDVKPMEME